MDTNLLLTATAVMAMIVALYGSWKCTLPSISTINRTTGWHYYNGQLV